MTRESVAVSRRRFPSNGWIRCATLLVLRDAYSVRRPSAGRIVLAVRCTTLLGGFYVYAPFPSIRTRSHPARIRHGQKAWQANVEATEIWPGTWHRIEFYLSMGDGVPGPPFAQE